MKLLVYLCLFFFQFAEAATPLNTTIMLFNHHDLERCQDSVLRAQDIGNTRIHLVPTIFAKLNKKKIQTYLYKDRHAKIQKFSASYLENYHSQLLSCIQYSLDLDLDVYLTPHVDDVNKTGVLRYYLDYSPEKNYDGFSFAQIMFYYLNTLEPRYQKRLYLSLTGETDKSLYKHINDYETVVNKLDTDLKIGFSFSLLQSQRWLPHFRRISFINQLDFLGVSAYNAIKRNCTPASFEKIAQRFWKKMRRMGMRKRLPLHFTEVGLGGSLKGSFYSALFPIYGQTGKYEKSKDPWQLSDNFELRNNYYRCLLGFLEKTPTIQAAFIWNSDSWDVQGFYPYSADYRDETISKWIFEHNQKIEK